MRMVKMKKPEKNKRLPAVLAGLLCLAGGCASYNEQAAGFAQAWNAGNFPAAAAEVNKTAEARAGSRDAVVWRLEQGAVLRGAGRLEPSNRAFDLADEKISEFETRAKTSVSEEFQVLLTNLSKADYRGHACDRVMLNTYKALNYMELGEMEKARVELNRALQRQRDAVTENARRIEAAREAAAQKRKGAADQPGYDISRTQNDPRFQAKLDQIYARQDQIKPYADYVNPFSVFLDGLYFLTQGTSPSDVERARKSFERVLQMTDDNEYIRQDYELAEKVKKGQALSPVTYVIFETGRAPGREEVRIDVPLFLVNNEVPYAGIALPRLVYHDDHTPFLIVNTPAGEARTRRLCSMDSVVTTEFDNEFPVVVTKTLIAAGAKALASYGIKEATKDEGWAGVLAQVATTVYQAAMNQADLRCWKTLPKEFQYCRLPTPADRRLTLTAPGTNETKIIDLADGIVNVVYARAVSAAAPLSGTRFTLGPKAPGMAAAE